MTRPRSLLVLLAVAACRGPADPGGDRTDPHLTVETAETGAEPLEELDARLHPDFGTLVIVNWSQDRDAVAHAEFTTGDGVWHSSPPRTLGPGAHEEYLLGLPYETTVTWRVVLEDQAGPVSLGDRQITTASWPPSLPAAEVTVSEPALWDPAMPYVLVAVTEVDGNMGDPWWVLIVDRQARPVWAWRTSDTHTTFHPRIGNDGRSLLLDNNAYWGVFGSGGEASTITRMLLDGTVVETWDAPGLHHPFVELPDGTIAYGAITSSAGYWYGNEYLVEIAPTPDRTTRTVFDCEAWLASIGVDHYCGSNTLTYRAETDSYLFSFYSLDSILDISRSTGLPTRTFGQVPGSYAFDPPGAGMWWQHGGYWTEQGTLLTSTYAVEGSPQNHPEGEETVVREYAVDEDDRTLRVVWDFGVGDGVYGAQMGEAHRLPNGNVLHNLGTLARLREGRPDGTVVWDAEWSPRQDIGRSVPIANLYDFLPERP